MLWVFILVGRGVRIVVYGLLLELLGVGGEVTDFRDCFCKIKLLEGEICNFKLLNFPPWEYYSLCLYLPVIDSITNLRVLTA